MARIPPRSQDPCTEHEVLAAFVEGRLSGQELDVVIRHLSDCEACREVVAESRALLSALEMGDVADIAPIQASRGSRGVRRLVAIAAGVVLGVVSLMLFLQREVGGVSSTLAKLAAENAEERMPADWADPRWAVNRGPTSRTAEKTIAFRLGVRSADLGFAIASENWIATNALAMESARTLKGLPFAESAASRLEDLAARAEADPSIAEMSRQLEAVERELESFIDEEPYRLGRWAECGRLLAISGTDLKAPSPPKMTESSSTLLELVNAAAASAPESPPAKRAGLYERVILAGASTN